MDSIIEKLNKKVEDMGLQVIDERKDPKYNFTYCLAVRTEKSIFVVYTTKGYFHLRKNSCLRLFEVSAHLPFDAVKPWEGSDFISPYTKSLLESGKCIVNYDRCFTLEEVINLLNS